MYTVIASGRLRDGVDEATMLAASERFQRELVDHHPGVLRRTLVADGAGGYADIVLFADEPAIAAIMEAERHSEAALAFMSMWDGGEPSVHRVLQLHEATSARTPS